MKSFEVVVKLTGYVRIYAADIEEAKRIAAKAFVVDQIETGMADIVLDDDPMIFWSSGDNKTGPYAEIAGNLYVNGVGEIKEEGPV